MQRIESNVATQIADQTRPLQASQDVTDQANQARVRDQQPDQLVKRDISPGELGDVVSQMQKIVQAATGRALSFEVDDERKDMIVTVKDSDGEVIRQIPSEEVMDLRRRLEDHVGVFLDDIA
ncbi:MAG: flagellar protein FlaG [Planctomycetota bacterium]|nr:MAG: flagellar protein FlaG [Planctomycetota bacterium]